MMMSAVWTHSAADARKSGNITVSSMQFEYVDNNASEHVPSRIVIENGVATLFRQSKYHGNAGEPAGIFRMPLEAAWLERLRDAFPAKDPKVPPMEMNASTYFYRLALPGSVREINVPYDPEALESIRPLRDLTLELIQLLLQHPLQALTVRVEPAAAAIPAGKPFAMKVLLTNPGTQAVEIRSPRPILSLNWRGPLPTPWISLAYPVIIHPVEIKSPAVTELRVEPGKSLEVVLTVVLPEPGEIFVYALLQVPRPEGAADPEPFWGSALSPTVRMQVR